MKEESAYEPLGVYDLKSRFLGPVPQSHDHLSFHLVAVKLVDFMLTISYSTQSASIQNTIEGLFLL